MDKKDLLILNILEKIKENIWLSREDLQNNYFKLDDIENLLTQLEQSEQYKYINPVIKNNKNGFSLNDKGEHALIELRKVKGNQKWSKSSFIFYFACAAFVFGFLSLLDSHYSKKYDDSGLVSAIDSIKKTQKQLLILEAQHSLYLDSLAHRVTNLETLCK